MNKEDILALIKRLKIRIANCQCTWKDADIVSHIHGCESCKKDQEAINKVKLDE